jgi:hypothetical protein
MMLSRACLKHGKPTGVTYEVTTSDIIIEAEVVVDTYGATIARAWFVYDPEPSQGDVKRASRLVKIPVEPRRLGRLECEHLIEQAEWTVAR